MAVQMLDVRGDARKCCKQVRKSAQGQLGDCLRAQTSDSRPEVIQLPLGIGINEVSLVAESNNATLRDVEGELLPLSLVEVAKAHTLDLASEVRRKLVDLGSLEEALGLGVVERLVTWQREAGQASAELPCECCSSPGSTCSKGSRGGR